MSCTLPNGYSLVTSERSSSEFLGVDIIAPDGEWAGLASVVASGVGSPPLVSLHYVEVDPAHRRKGVCAAVVKCLTDRLRSAGVSAVHVTPHSDARGEMVGAAVFGRLGFELESGMTLASKMAESAADGSHQWPDGLIDRVHHGEASIAEVMDADVGGFLSSSDVSWLGMMLFHGSGWEGHDIVLKDLLP
jgi:predicted N-acetyltransferase YhbS